MATAKHDGDNDGDKDGDEDEVTNTRMFCNTWRDTCRALGDQGCQQTCELACRGMGAPKSWILAFERAIALIELRRSAPIPDWRVLSRLDGPVAIAILNPTYTCATFEHRMVLLPCAADNSCWRLQSLNFGPDHEHAHAWCRMEPFPAEATKVHHETIVADLIALHAMGWNASVYNRILGHDVVPIGFPCENAQPRVFVMQLQLPTN